MFIRHIMVTKICFPIIYYSQIHYPLHHSCHNFRSTNTVCVEGSRFLAVGFRRFYFLLATFSVRSAFPWEVTVLTVQPATCLFLTAFIPGNPIKFSTPWTILQNAHKLSQHHGVSNDIFLWDLFFCNKKVSC